MAINADLHEAFDTALAVIQRERSAGMTCADGSSAAANLDKLERDVSEARQRAIQQGSVDTEWFQTTVRWLVEWVPESELTLIAALGGIVRANHSTSM